MVEIKDKKVVKTGGSFYFPIPKKFIESGEVEPEEKYDAIIKKSGDENTSE